MSSLRSKRRRPARPLAAFFLPLLALAVALVQLIGLRAARAEDPADLGVRLLVEQGDAPLELRGSGADVQGTFIIENAGPAPVVAGPPELRPTTMDGPAIPWVHVAFEGGGLTRRLAPGERQRVIVGWRAAQARASSLHAHALVPVRSEAEPRRQQELALGLRAMSPRAPLLARFRPLTLLLAVPLLGALLALGASLAGRADSRLLRPLASAVLGVDLLLALGLRASFDTELARAHGNAGFQFVERAVLSRGLGVEYHVGLDGLSMGLVVLTLATAFAGALAYGGPAGSGRARFLALFQLAVAASLALFVALDLLILLLAWGVLLLALVLLLAGWAGPSRRRVALRFGVHGAGGLVLFAAGGLWLRELAGPGLLADGHVAARVSALTELSASAFRAGEPVLLGLGPVELAWAALALGASSLLAVVPLHGAHIEARAAAPAPFGMLAAAVLLAAGTYLLARVPMTLLPETTVWASPLLVGLGLVSLLFAGARGLGEPDLARFSVNATSACAGLVLVGLGSLTPQGLEAALAVAFAHGVAVAVLHGVAGALDQRIHSRDARSLGGLAFQTPRLAAALGIALFTLAGFPGLAGFWGHLLALVGAFPRSGPTALLVVVGLALLAAQSVRTLRRVALGPTPEAFRRSKYLEPHGGTLPDLRARELAAILPLLILAVAVGLWPGLLLEPANPAVLDLHRELDPPGRTQVASAPTAPTSPLAVR